MKYRHQEHIDMGKLPHLYLDWDYDTYIRTPDGIYMLFDAPDVDFLVISGSVAVGLYMQPTVMQRVPGTRFNYIVADEDEE